MLGRHAVLDQLLRILIRHITNHAALYFFLFILFTVGVAFGALATGALDDTQQLELLQYLEFFLEVVDGQAAPPPSTEVFMAALNSHLRTVGLVFLLGLTVLGAPLIPLIIFLRGFILGFAVGFLVSQLGWAGILMALLVILPQNLLFVPAILILAANALLFALAVLRSRREQLGPPWRDGAALAVITAIVSVIVTAASLLEGYVAPLLLRMIARWWT